MQLEKKKKTCTREHPISGTISFINNYQQLFISVYW